MIGLTQKEQETLIEVFKKFKNIKEVILFCSRALGRGYIRGKYKYMYY